jgi:tripartite-type tricarboxylate transporter receptor subunit TctC
MHAQSRHLFLKLFLLAAVALFTPLSQTQTGPYPNRNITFMVPFTTGTTADVLGRLLGTKLAERWGVGVITENRTGVAGLLGSDAVAKAPANGYMILFTATSHGTVPATRSKMPYDPIKSFEPVILLGTSAMCLLVNPKLPAKDLKEFTELLKAKPGQLDYASPGTGGVQHLGTELFLQETGLRMTHVPYKGSAGAMTDLVGGHVQATLASLQTASTFIHNNQLRPLAVMSDERSPAFSQIPSIKELGYPNLVVETWYGVLAPVGTPNEVVQKINTELNAIMQLPEVKDTFARQGVVIAGGKPERLSQLLQREVPKWSKVVAAAKINIE